MLACIPTQGNAGIEDRVNEHFGSAPYFTLYDSSTEEIKIVENRNAHHSHGTCHPMNQLTRYHIDCVVCTGMGRRAIEALTSEGVRVYQAPTDKVDDVVEKIKTNDLVLIDPASACRGQGQHGTCGHRGFGPDDVRGGLGRGSGFGQGPGRGQGRGGGRGRLG
jgi:predicted Fe-Mo cluster-binding NifX family protein